MASQRRSHQGIAGAIAAVTALGVAESLSSLDATSPTIVEAAGLTFIDQFAATLKDVAVAIFGTHHKTALIIGTWVVIIGFAAFASRSTTKSRRNFTLLVAVIGAVGLAAFLTRPLRNAPLGISAITTGLATGLMLHRYLLRVAMPATTAEDLSFERPGEALGNRRQFMMVAGSAVVGATAATTIATTVRRRSLNTEPAVTA
ncbi:MAG: hypothetical protein ACO38E_09355, partial [Ilumatobacteraceae bacterium]